MNVCPNCDKELQDVSVEIIQKRWSKRKWHHGFYEIKSPQTDLLNEWMKKIDTAPLGVEYLTETGHYSFCLKCFLEFTVERV